MRKPIPRSERRWFWDSIWRLAFKVGICPRGLCSLTERTCWHLDRYICPSEHWRVLLQAGRIDPPAPLSDPVGEYTLAAWYEIPRRNTRESREFQRLISGKGLNRLERSTLIDHFVFGMSVREIAEEVREKPRRLDFTFRESLAKVHAGILSDRERERRWSRGHPSSLSAQFRQE